MTEPNELQRAVLEALADHGSLTEGELKSALWRSWSLYPTLRALHRRDLIVRDEWWFSYRITDAGLKAIGRPTRLAQLSRRLTVIQGGKAA